MTTRTAPYVSLSWTATALGAQFGGYNIYRRPTRGAAPNWTQIGAISVPTAYTPGNVETLHNAFRDYEAGWAIANGQWADGFDYAVSVINSLTGLESLVQPTLHFQANSGLSLADLNPWVVCNAAPFYNFPIASMQALNSADDTARQAWRIAGRDTAVARTRAELPPRTWTLGSRYFARLGEDQARVWRAAAASGLPFAVQDPLGDRLIGVLEALNSLPHEAEGTYTATGNVIETGKDTNLLADYNVPAGLVFASASSQAVTIPDNALLDPATTFALVYYGTAPAVANSWLVTKGNTPGTNQGYGLQVNGAADRVQFVFQGSTTSGTCGAADAGGLDGNKHTWLATSTGTAQSLYRDGVLIASASVTHGAITNAIAFSIASNNGGTANFSSPTVGAWAFYNQFFGAPQALQMHRYLTGCAGVRPLAGPAMFMDLRDLRTWDGRQVITTLNDLSGNGLSGTLVAAPKTQGIPWPLVNLDRF